MISVEVGYRVVVVPVTGRARSWDKPGKEWVRVGAHLTALALSKHRRSTSRAAAAQFRALFLSRGDANQM